MQLSNSLHDCFQVVHCTPSTAWLRDVTVSTSHAKPPMRPNYPAVTPVSNSAIEACDLVSWVWLRKPAPWPDDLEPHQMTPSPSPCPRTRRDETETCNNRHNTKRNKMRPCHIMFCWFCTAPSRRADTCSWCDALSIPVQRYLDTKFIHNRRCIYDARLVWLAITVS